MSAVSSSQIRSLQARRKQAGMDDDTYRGLLMREAGVESTRALTSAQAEAILAGLPTGAAPRRRSAARMDGPYAARARALWISGYWLGVVADRRDEALLAFVERQTGLKSLSWVREAADGAKVIEALKAWLAREAGVKWSHKTDPKKAVLAAIFDRLVARGIWLPPLVAGGPRYLGQWGETHGLPPDVRAWTPAQLDRAITIAGAVLREAMAREERA